MTVENKMESQTIFTTSSGRDLVYSFIPGVGSPLVFLNGLGDSMDCWFEVLQIAKIQRPCLMVDLPGQGASLQRDLEMGRDWQYALTVEDQVQFLSELLAELQIDQFGIVGFSYGGGVALGLLSKYQEKIEDLILLLPFILRLDLSFPLSRFWVAQFDFMKALTPKELRQPFHVIEKSYERFINHYMDFRYLKRIPEAKHRQVAVELSRGIMEFNSFQAIPYLPENKLVVATSGMDTLVPQSLYQEFWYRIPEDKKKAWINILDGEHLIIEQAPAFVAKLILQALEGHLTGVHRVTLASEKKSASMHEPA